MQKYIFFGAALSALVLVGAVCNKETPPVTEGTSASETVVAPAEENKDEAKTDTTGTVNIDIRQDEQSASPKALAGDKEPAPSQNQQSSPSQPLNPSTGADQEPSQPVSSVPTTKSFTITASQWAFSPNTITVKQGDLVRLRVNSIDVSHGLMIPDYDINKVLNPGETVLIEFTADKKGTFSFRCSVQCGGGHPDMKGTLIVE
ncbi:MAG: cupredoxin domain-containing protein [Candidatus Magasanikbacteria bacterium]|nr:cupredoxin domain-containing protein [Candidatus Magasanikbacteria bacterium]